MQWMIYFSITLFLEMLGVMILRFFIKDFSYNVFLSCLVANFISHPLLYYYSMNATFTELIIAEFLVVFFEAYIYRSLGKLELIEALGLAFLLNGLSWGVGKLVLIYAFN